MKQQQSSRDLLYLAGTIVAIICSIYLLSDVSSLMNRKADTTSDNSALSANIALKKINESLTKKIVQDTFVYTASFESPFKLFGDPGPVRPSLFKNSAPVNRTKLILKGVLQKNAPLAILEDERGETYIRGVGEKALDQEIVKIMSNSITLRDAGGTYDLVVQEQ